LVATLAVAADVTITGSKLTVIDNVLKPTKKKATFKSADVLINAGVEDPRVSGATIELVNPTPGFEQSVSFTLPPAAWLAIGNPVQGYKYKDSLLVNGPVKTAQIRNGKQLKFTAKGATMAYGMGGFPQTEIGVVITIGSTRFCTTFGGIVTKDDGLKFSAKLAPAPGACPSIAPTTTTSSTTPTTTSSSSSTSSTSSSTSTTIVITTTTSSSSSSTSSTTTTVTTTTNVPTGIVDPNSAVLVTSNCLTNGAGAQLGIQITLVDTNAVPMLGATVVINSTAGFLSPVTASGNVYRAVLVNPASGTSATISVTANGTPLNTQPVITLSAPFTDATGGAGGCPQDGNLRVRVLSELGGPVAGASVMVGSSEQTNVYTSFFGFPPTGANTATTDANGYAVFRDFGAALTGPVTITAGAANREYVTLVGVDASDVVLPLKQVVPGGFFGTLTGDVNGISSSGNVEGGVVLGDVTLNALASFNLTSLLADSACYNTGVAGNLAIPNNLFIPSQTVIIFNLSKKPYTSALLPFGTRHVIALGGNIPTSALTGGDINAAISQFTFTNITAQTFNINSPGPTTNNFNVGSYDAQTACTATGAPGTHAFCIAGMDWDGNTTPTHNVGEGALGVFSFKASSIAGGLVNLTGVNYRSKAAGAPFTTVGHLGATVSLNLDKSAITIPPGTANGISAVLKRDFPSDTFPGSFAYGAMYPIRVQTQTGRTLALDAPAGLTGAQYVKHTLSQEVTVAYSACSTNDSERTSLNPLWEVYAPATASVTLPTLPASFPRATLGGNLPGLIDPTATAEDDKIIWSSTTVREGLNGSFDYDAIRFSGFQKYGTQFTTNSGDYLP
jgi:hypothetical protein